MTERAALRLIAGVVTLTALVLAVDGAVSVASGAYLNLGSGVWLALARDTYEGVFYRPIWSGAEYGGTRYFPMLFVLIAGLMRAGVSAVPAGVAVSLLGLAALAAGVAVLLRRLAVPPALTALGTALAVAPYFVHQTAFAIRCEPLAAAFAVFGLAVLAPMDARAASDRRLMLAAGLFACAFMTKVTCVYAPAAAVVALLLAGGRAAAFKLATMTVAGAAVGLAAVHVASSGRALESFRACALAGASLASLLSPVTVMRPLTLIGTSHLLTVVFVMTVAAVAVSWRRAMQLPALYFMATAGITAVIFTSPGTILTSQIVDLYVAAVVVLTTAVSRQAGALRPFGYAALAGLSVWSAGQNVARVSRMIAEGAPATAAEERGQLLGALEACQGSLVSESPLIPILAGERPILLDPFAFHVVALNRPEVERDLVERIRRREFACVVLEQDPATARGRQWYRNVNLTEPLIDAMLGEYRLDRIVGGQSIYLRLR